MPHTPSIKPRSHQGFADRRVLPSEQLIDNNFPYDNQFQEVYCPNMAFNHQATAPINWLEPVVSEATLLGSVMVEQTITQAVTASVEMFDATKSKFESWIASVENAARISKQDILHISFSKMKVSPLTSTHMVRHH